MMNKFKDYFQNLNSQGNYTKASECNFRNNFYFGRDEDNNPTMLLYYIGKIHSVSSSQLINVQIRRLKSENVIKFTLMNESYFDQFEKICLDIIEYTNKKQNHIEIHTISRWESWRILLNNLKSDELGEYIIKGLIGELFTIIKLCEEGIEIDKVINAWSGPDSSHQDFMFEQHWVEVKTTSMDSDVISIPSIEQLDSSIKGVLQVYEVYKVTDLVEDSLNLNKLHNKICSLINSDDVFTKYMLKLSQVGYVSKEYYDHYNYSITGDKKYSVNNAFPCIRRNSIPNSIEKLSYTLYKNKIDEWVIK